ncbi:hypothetical protein PUMCH_001184 [Australozyma saopauloensis]|uniref:C2 domain-containing protein n=1 Tax=Australozyma saopauloensis TaxID=291208 RepID=A0AAX4H6P9_9ASCO|nr:hypothetical protein PUMCH_001184 [[Candida] saopauloensis]
MMQAPSSKRRTEKGILSPRQSRANSPSQDDPELLEVDLARLYEYVLKVILLDYITEVRFYQPVAQPELTRTESRPLSELRRSRMSRFDGDTLLPSYLVADLKAKLNLIAMASLNHDDLTRRLLLRFYGELLDPRVVDEIKRGASVDILVMKFVSTANKEVVKLALVSSEDVALVVFRQTETFVDIIMLLVQRDRNSEAIINKLNEHKSSLKPGTLKSRPSFNSTQAGSFKYTEPSFKVSDLDQGYVSLLYEIFRIDQDILQADIQRLRPFVSPKTIHKDMNKFLLLIAEDASVANNFATTEDYDEWKKRTVLACDYISKKYPIPATIRLRPVPDLPVGEEFYFSPPQHLISLYHAVFVKLCLLHQRQQDQSDFNSNSLLFTKKSGELILQCSRIWRMDAPTRAVSLIKAAQLGGILTDPLCVSTPSEIGPIQLSSAASVFQACKRIIDEANLDWDEKDSWSLQDKSQWVQQLGNVYAMCFHSLRECLGSVLSRVVKPKFSPYLQFLDDYVESDCLFYKFEELGGVSKWKKRLSKTLVRTSEALYAEHLATLPRDDTISVLHVLDIADGIIKDIKFLQKRYPHPLLDFMNIGRTYAEIVSTLFAADAAKILAHITSLIQSKGEFLNYGDALEVYKTLCEIRSIHKQVSTKLQFAFDLEAFSFPYLQSWVQESNDKICEFVQNALASDDFKPMDLEDEDKKYSSSVHDIFTLIRHYLGILSDLKWENAYQLAKVKTSFMKSISSCCIMYANEISDMVMHDLTLETESPVPTQNSWLTEAKLLVEQKLGSEKLEEEPVNFTPRTCVGLNNLGAMITQLSKLEDILEPEAVSATVLARDPTARHKYSNHVFTVRIVRGENIRSASESSTVKPYVTLIDTVARRTIAKTRTVEGDTPTWDEEFEASIPANDAMSVSVTVWEDSFKTHGVCGRALIQLDPRKFKHDGIPQEVYLDLDSQGRLLIEIAVESEREDAIFAMGRAHRALKRAEQRIIKLIVARFSRCVKRSFSRQTLKSICGGSGNLKPTEEQQDQAMMPLYDFLNVNLLVLAECLTKNLLLSVMLEAWNVVIDSADELLLPKLTSSKALRLIGMKNKIHGGGQIKLGWQSAVTSAVVNVTNSIGNLGFGKVLTTNEIETVIGWLNFLCIDFFHNGGNGPPILDLKTDKYQSLLLVPVYYDTDVTVLVQEVDRLSPAFVQTLRDKNNVLTLSAMTEPSKLRSRAGSIARSLTIRANATAKAREKAAKEARELQSDPLTAQTSAENIILRMLILRNEKSFVSRRLEQRERLAHTLATERLAKAVAEGTMF